MRTPGKPLIHEKGKTVISRTHDVRGNTVNGRPDCWRPLTNAEGSLLFKKLILLVRDFRECYLGEARPNLDLLKIYTENIKAYHNFPGEKMLVYYEDMIRDFAEVSRVLNFVGILHNPREFDLESHRKNSLLYYHRRRFSHTRNCLHNFRFHASSASSGTIKQIESRIMSLIDKELREKYLSRYFDEV